MSLPRAGLSLRPQRVAGSLAASRRIVRGAWALLCAVLVLGAGSAWAGPLEDARKLLGQGHGDEARKVVTDFLAANPGNRDGRFLLANILASQGQLEAAYAIFAELVAQAPDDPIGVAIRRLFEERGASAKDAARVAALLGEAQKAAQAKRWDDAIRALSEAVGLVPGNVPAQSNLAQLLGEDRRYAEAIPHMEEAVRRHPKDMALVRRLAVLYERADRPEDAARVYREVIQAVPNDVDALFALGRVALFSEKDNPKAADYFQRILKTAPDNTDALFLLGSAQGGMGQTDIATRTYLRVLAVDPRYFRAYFELGKIHEAAGREGEALKAFQDTVRYGGDSPEAEQSQRRLSLFGTSPEVARRVREMLDRGVAALDAGDLAGAEQTLKGVLALVPGNALALYNLATVYTRQGKNEPAIEALKGALKSDPTHFPSHYGLALIYVGAGRFEDAYEEYKAVVRYAPPDNPLYAESKARVDSVEKILATFAAKKDARDAFLKGNELAGKEQLEDALTQYERAVQLDDQNPFYYYNAGVVNVELGHLSEGFQALKKAVALKPDHVQSHFRLGLFYSLTGFPQEAMKEFRLVLRYGTTEPEVAEARKRIADVLGAADHKEKALAYLFLANALDASKQPQKALEAILEARRNNPAHRGIQLRQMELLMELNKPDEARELALSVVAEHPDDSKFQYYLGKVEGNLGHLDAALAALQAASAAAPEDTEIQLTLAAALEQAKKTDEAVATLRAVLARNPDQANVVLDLGRLLRRLNRPAEAAALYDWYLSTHAETTEMLVERGLLAVVLGSARAGAEEPEQTALAGIVTGAETLTGQPKYATSADWFERAIEVAGPNDQRFVDFARAQLEQSRRLRINLTQTVIDYNTNANNSPTNPQTGVSSRIVFDALYVLYRSPHLAVPVGVTTDHSLYYTFQTYVNQNTLSLSGRGRFPHLLVTPDVSVSRVRTQRGKTSDSYAAGIFASLDVPYPQDVSADYHRTEFTSFTNPTNNYLQERLDLRVGQTADVGGGFQVNGQLRYIHLVLDAVAAIYDTDRTDRQATLGVRRNFAGQRTVATSVFLTDSTEIRTTNFLPTDPTHVLPIDSRNAGANAAFSFPIYPHVTGTISGTYSFTDFMNGILQSFTDPTTGDRVTIETATREASVSYFFRLTYRPDAKTNWSFDLRHLEARSSVDVPVDVQDILTDQVNLSNINSRDTATVTMTYAF